MSNEPLQPSRAMSSAGRRILVSMIALIVAGHCQATTISPTLSIGMPPVVPGTGLLATYTVLANPPANLTAAASAATGAIPTATYLASTICFPTCVATEQDGNTLASYVAANGTNLVGSATLGPSYTTYTGYLAIFAPGTYQYNLTSDDGSELIIGGATIIDMLGQQTWSGASASVTYTAAGLYAIGIEQFDAGGYTGITLQQNWSAIPQSDLYASIPLQGNVSEPPSVLLFATGMIALGVLRKRRTDANSRSAIRLCVSGRNNRDIARPSFGIRSYILAGH